MGFLSKLLGSPLKDAADIIGRFVTDPDKKLEAQRELAKLEAEYQLKLLEADVQWAQAQADVIKTEAASESWLTANWRPMLMTVFTYIIFHNYVLVPLFALRSTTIPEQMWTLLTAGVSGYIVGRSAEKALPAVADVLKSIKK